MKRYISQVTVAVFGAICCLGCSPDSPDAIPSNAPAARPLPIDDRAGEPWISEPKSEWPQIVLTNFAEFHGHSSLQGASSFLIKINDVRVLAATAAHLIGSAGGVEPVIPINQLTQKIRSWRMFPRTMPDAFVEVTSLGAQGLDDERFDWLVLSIKESDQLSAYPLKLRREPVRIGETVFLIGCPYIERNCKQNVYTGVITERALNRFRYDLDPPVDIRGFSGAPIIDEKGYLVGVMMVWFHPRMSGEKYLEAGGEDVAVIYDLLQPVE